METQSEHPLLYRSWTEVVDVGERSAEEGGGDDDVGEWIVLP